jgi:hypothetical protein
MDERRPDALTGDALDRELREALQVDPSPEFVARVRAQVAHETMSRPWLRPVMGIGGGLAAAASAMAAIAVLWSPVPPPAGRRASVPVTPFAERAEPPPVAGVAVVPPAAGLVPAPVRRASLPPAPPVPQALFSDDEQQALRWLLTVASGRPVEGVPLHQPVEPMEVHEAAIAPLAIEPLAQLSRLEQE